MDKRVPAIVLGGTLVVLALVALIGSQEQDTTVHETSVVQDEMVLAMARQMKLDAVDVKSQNQLALQQLQQLEAQPKQEIAESESQMADDLAFEALEAVQKKYPRHDFLFKNDKKLQRKIKQQVNTPKKVQAPRLHEPKWLAGNGVSSDESKKNSRNAKATLKHRVHGAHKVERMASHVNKKVLSPIADAQKKQKQKKQKQQKKQEKQETAESSIRALRDDTKLANKQVAEEREETKALRAKMSNTRQHIYLDEANGAVPANGNEEVFVQQAATRAHDDRKKMSKSVKKVMHQVRKIKEHAKFVKRELRHAKTTVKQASPHGAHHSKPLAIPSKKIGKLIHVANKELYGNKKPAPVMPPIDYAKIGLEEAKREMRREALEVHHIAATAVVKPKLAAKKHAHKKPAVKPKLATKKHAHKKPSTAILSATIMREADRAAARALRKAESSAKDVLLRDLELEHHHPVIAVEPAVVALGVKPKKKKAVTKTSTVQQVAAKVARDSAKVAKAAAKSAKKQAAAQKAATVAKSAAVAAKQATATAKQTEKKSPKGSVHIATVAKKAAKITAKIAKVAKANTASLSKKKDKKKDKKKKTSKPAQSATAKVATAAKKAALDKKEVKKINAHTAAAAKLAKVAAHVAAVAASNGRRRGVMKWNGHAYVKPTPGKVKAKAIMAKEKVGAQIIKVARKVAKDADTVAKHKAAAAQVAAKTAITTAALTKATAAKLNAKMASLVKETPAHATVMVNTEAKTKQGAEKKLETISRQVSHLAHQLPRVADAKKVVMKAAAKILHKRHVRNATKRLASRMANARAKVAVAVQTKVQTKAKVTVARPPASMDCHSCRARLLATCGRLSSLLQCEQDARYSQLFSTIRDSCRTFLGLVQLPDGSLTCPTSSHKSKPQKQAKAPTKAQGARNVKPAAAKVAHKAAKVAPAQSDALVSSSESDLHKAVGLMRASKNQEEKVITQAQLSKHEQALASKASHLAEDAAEKAFMESFGTPSGEWATAEVVPAAQAP